MDEIEVHCDFLVFLVRLLASAEQVHDAAERPAVDVEARGKTFPCLWSAPLLEAGATGNLSVCVFKHHRDIEVNYVDLEAPLASIAALLVTYLLIGLLLD